MLIIPLQELFLYKLIICKINFSYKEIFLLRIIPFQLQGVNINEKDEKVSNFTTGITTNYSNEI